MAAWGQGWELGSAGDRRLLGMEGNVLTPERGDDRTTLHFQNNH